VSLGWLLAGQHSLRMAAAACSSPCCHRWHMLAIAIATLPKKSITRSYPDTSPARRGGSDPPPRPPPHFPLAKAVVWVGWLVLPKATPHDDPLPGYRDKEVLRLAGIPCATKIGEGPWWVERVVPLISRKVLGSAGARRNLHT
jgi:hypothetical protein